MTVDEQTGIHWLPGNDNGNNKKVTGGKIHIRGYEMGVSRSGGHHDQ